LGKVTTLRLAVDPDALDSEQSRDALRRAAAILRSGGTVAFPTETVYGLGANALDPEAVQRIFEAKRRPAWDPLIVHVIDVEQLERVAAEIPARAQLLMGAFWPGPLTLLLPKAAAVPAIVTAGRPKVGVRMPSDPVARKLIEFAQVPLAAPSANSFGRTSPTRAEFVLEDLEGRIDAIIDSGQTSLGLESTVVDPCDEPPVFYRPGMVTFEQVQALCGTLVRYSPGFSEASDQSSLSSQPSPGVGLKHYAPRARLILTDFAAPGATLRDLAESLRARGDKVGVMLPDLAEGSTEAAGFLDAIGTKATSMQSTGAPPQLSYLDYLIYRWGNWMDHGELARRLFAGLRELDAAGATAILCPLPEDEGIGRAIRDRLIKAARNV
jgi:L-threonylcarbamoyladenylate synthase